MEVPLLDNPSGTYQSFPILSLPIEIRLRIYALVLPTRSHTIVTQYPQNGYYYSSLSLISNSKQTIYPAHPQSSPSPFSNINSIVTLTTYKFLTANFRSNFPNPSICPKLLLACRQIKEEAEPIMYGGDAVFDFGVYADAVIPFLQDRSAVARRKIRHIRLAREIPVLGSNETSLEGVGLDILWDKTCAFLRDKCTDLRAVDLIVWPDTEGLIDIPSRKTAQSPHDQEEEAEKFVNDEELWHQWKWTSHLLNAEFLRYVKITWWEFAARRGAETGFDSWLGRRMVADEVIRDVMIRCGRVNEGEVFVRGKWYLS